MHLLLLCLAWFTQAVTVPASSQELGNLAAPRLTEEDEAEPGEPPFSMALRLDPAFDPWQRPWKVQLTTGVREGSWPRVLAEAATDETGLARLSGLDSRQAVLVVQDADNRRWHEQELELYPDMPEVFVALDVVAVEGRLSRGEDPLEGTLAFGTTQGSDIRMRSGQNGRFSGYLPSEGIWEVELVDSRDDYDAQRLRSVEVKRRPGKTYAEVELRVPATTLAGRVLAEGKPVVKAGVTVVRELEASQRERHKSPAVREAITTTDAEGRFRLRGLEPGKLSLRAAQGERDSDWVRFELREEAWPEEVVLELLQRQTLSGMIHFGSLPVAGARLVALPALPSQGQRAGYLEATTGAGGEFELSVPSSAPSLDLLVAAPAFGAEMVRLVKHDDGWGSPLIGIGSDMGTLRVPVTDRTGDRDFSAGLIVSRNGASFRLSALVRLLTLFGQLDLGPGQVLLRGLAAGNWTLCREEDRTCRSGELPALGDLTLDPPAAGDQGSSR